jgi:tight adherence protein B
MIKKLFGGIIAKKADEKEFAPGDYRIYRLNSQEKFRYYLIGGLIAAGLGLLFYHNFFLAGAMAAAAMPGRKYYAAHLAAARRNELALQFKDMLASLSASFACGRQMTEALQEAEENLDLVYPQDAPINRELRYINRRLTDGREPEKTVLHDFACRSANEDILNFTDVYFTCLTTGGDLIQAIRRAADQIMDKIEIRREISKLTSQKRFEAKILAGLPPMILFFLQIASPGYLSPLYGSLGGMCVMTIALAGMVGAFLWSTRITDISV